MRRQHRNGVATADQRRSEADPLGQLLSEAAHRTEDRTVRQWLEALLRRGEPAQQVERVDGKRPQGQSQRR